MAILTTFYHDVLLHNEIIFDNHFDVILVHFASTGKCFLVIVMSSFHLALLAVF